MFTTAPTSFARTFVAAVGTTLFAGICLFGATAPAAAATGEPRVATIAYSDLNLANSAGRQALEARIARTARSVCAENSRDQVLRAAEKQCVAAAVAGARAQLYPVTASAN